MLVRMQQPNAFDELTAQLQQLQQTGSLTHTQAQTLLSLAQQLQLGSHGSLAVPENEDWSSTVAIANSGRRRRFVRWDTSAVPHFPPPSSSASTTRLSNPVHEDMEDNDAASAAALAPSEYTRDTLVESGDHEDDELDEEGEDFDTAEGHSANRDTGNGNSLLHTVPPNDRSDGADPDTAAADLPGLPRYLSALPGDDMDAAGKKALKFIIDSSYCLHSSSTVSPLISHGRGRR